VGVGPSIRIAISSKRGEVEISKIGNGKKNRIRSMGTRKEYVNMAAVSRSDLRLSRNEEVKKGAEGSANMMTRNQRKGKKQRGGKME